MLPAQHRLHRSEDFRTVIRNGTRVGGRYVALHVVRKSTCGPRVGFVVSSAVGNAVRRNRVKRRLRHIARQYLPQLTHAADIVVRALPRAGSADYGDLQRDLHRGLQKAGVVQR